MRKHSKVETTRQSADRRQVHQAKKRLWIGVDLGNRWSHVCLIDKRGEVVDRTRVRTIPEAMREFFGTYTGCAIAIEASAQSPWVRRVLSECGLDVTVANAREVRKIHQSDRKNDRSDAETLARLLRVDRKLLAPIEHRTEAMQADISVLRARDTLVGARTKCINAIRGLVKTVGVQLPKCSAEVFAHRVGMLIPRDFQAAVSPLLETIAHLTVQIRSYEKAIGALAREKYPETAALSHYRRWAFDIISVCVDGWRQRSIQVQSRYWTIPRSGSTPVRFRRPTVAAWNYQARQWLFTTLARQ